MKEYDDKYDIEMQKKTIEKDILLPTNLNNDSKKKLINFINNVNKEHEKKMNNPTKIWKMCHEKCKDCKIEKNRKCQECLDNCNNIHSCFVSNVNYVLGLLREDFENKIYKIKEKNLYKLNSEIFYNFLKNTSNSYLNKQTTNNKCFGYYYKEIMADTNPNNFTEKEKERISSNLDYYCSLMTLKKCGMDIKDSIKWLKKFKNDKELINIL